MFVSPNSWTKSRIKPLKSKKGLCCWKKCSIKSTFKQGYNVACHFHEFFFPSFASLVPTRYLVSVSGKIQTFFFNRQGIFLAFKKTCENNCAKACAHIFYYLATCDLKHDFDLICKIQKGILCSLTFLKILIAWKGCVKSQKSREVSFKPGKNVPLGASIFFIFLKFRLRVALVQDFLCVISVEFPYKTPNFKI